MAGGVYGGGSSTIVRSAVNRFARAIKETEDEDLALKTQTILTADATTLSVTGLDGDADGVYEIEGDLIVSLSPIIITAEPNGSASDLFSVYALLDVAKSNVNSTWTLINQGATVTVFHHLRFKMTLHSARTKNGVNRNRSYLLNGEEGYDFSATNHQNTFQSAGTMENQTANLTSLDFISSVTDGILDGSQVTVRYIP